MFAEKFREARQSVNTRTVLKVGFVSLMLLVYLTSMTGGAVAQDDPEEEDFCETPVADTINNALTFLTVIGPLVGVLNAGWNMTKAAGTNQSSKKKEYKQNIQTSLIYGIGVGMLFALGGMIFNWAPGVSMC